MLNENNAICLTILSLEQTC